MQEAEDKHLMLQFQKEGDAAAFGSLFRRYRLRLFAFLLRVSGSRDVAEEISQQTWLKLVEVASAGGFDAERATTFQSYLFAMARNLYIDQHTRRHEATRSHTVPQDVLVELADRTLATSDDIESIDRKRVSEALHEALRSLPLEQREVIAMWADDMSVDEMSRIVSAPHDTIMSRKKYALAKLRAALQAASIDAVNLT